MKLPILNSRWWFVIPVLALVLGIVGLRASKAAPQEQVIQINTGGSYLGIEMEEVTADNMATYKLNAERGVIVRSVEKGSPAEGASLQAKDVILEYAGTPVQSSMQLARLVSETPQGRKVDLVISRDGKKLSLTVKTGKREGSDLFSDRDLEQRLKGPVGRMFKYDGKTFRFETPDGRSGPFAFSMPNLNRLKIAPDTPRLGVLLEPLTEQMAEFLGVPGKKGALVTSVTEGSAAASAKVKAGDVIVRADGKSIEEPEDLIRAVENKNGGEKMELKIVREKKEITVAVEIPSGDKKTRGYRM